MQGVSLRVSLTPEKISRSGGTVGGSKCDLFDRKIEQKLQNSSDFYLNSLLDLHACRQDSYMHVCVRM